MMLKLTPLKEADVGEIIEIVSKLDKEASAFVKDYFELYFDKRTSEHKSARMFRIHYGGAPVGCIGYARVWSDDVYEIIRMYVEPRFRNQGIGSLALAEIEKRLAKKKVRLLVIETGYSDARKFYEKNGFTMEGKIRDYFSVGEPNWFLSKKL